MSTVPDLVCNSEEFLCKTCGNLYSNPYTLSCGHTFCLHPCIMPRAPAHTEIACPSCKRVTKAAELSSEDRLAERVSAYKLLSTTTSSSSCSNCGFRCDGCRTCSHCNKYLCVECIKSHNELYSSVLLSRLLGLQIKYKRIRTRLGANQSGVNEGVEAGINSLRAAIESALLRAEIFIDSLEALVSEAQNRRMENPSDFLDMVHSLTSQESTSEFKDENKRVGQVYDLMNSEACTDSTNIAQPNPLTTIDSNKTRIDSETSSISGSENPIRECVDVFVGACRFDHEVMNWRAVDPLTEAAENRYVSRQHLLTSKTETLTNIPQATLAFQVPRLLRSDELLPTQSFRDRKAQSSRAAEMAMCNPTDGEVRCCSRSESFSTTRLSSGPRISRSVSA